MGSGCDAVAVTGVCLELPEVNILDQDWSKGGKKDVLPLDDEACQH